ncbi:MAG: zinc transporter ZntB [Pseudomonadota bacterium]
MVNLIDTISKIPKDDALLFGCVLDGHGGARVIDWAEALTWKQESPNETLWLHCDRTIEGMDGWLATRFAMNDETSEVLVSNETRPRSFREGGSIVAILRGVNLNDDNDPDDMIAMQIWATDHYVISLRRRQMRTPRDVLALLKQGRGPRGPGDLVTELTERLIYNLSKRIMVMNERIDALEAMDGTDGDVTAQLAEIAAIRRSCLAIKRYMAPQYDALVQIAEEDLDWLNPDHHRRLRETTERLKRYLDDIDVSKESALVLQDDLNNRAAQETNKTMYMLSIVAAIFLPLGFLTGLLGINVGGMPGVDTPTAFWVVVVLLIGVMALQYYLFKKLKWL